MPLLPVEKSKPKSKLSEFRFWFYGRPKIGKTSLALQFEDALVFAFEPGAESYEAYQIPIKSWADFVAAKIELKKSDRFKTLVFDTVDMAFLFCTRSVCAKLGVDDRADAGWGKGWNGVRDEFTKQILDLSHSGRGIIFLSHQGSTPYKDRNGKDRMRIVPSLKDKGAQILDAVVDIWAPILDVGGKRILRLRGDETVEAGHRINRTIFKKYIETEEIDLGQTPEEAYKALVDTMYPKQEKK